MDPTSLLIGFLAAAGFVTVAGYFLTKAGDELGNLLNLSGSWVGLIILSSVTSLPELVSSIGSASWQGQPDLACGNVFGSNCFNVFIIVILDFFYRGGPLSVQFGMFPSLSAGLGIMMTMLAGIAILSSQVSTVAPLPDWGWSSILLIAYFLSMSLLSRFERREHAKAREASSTEGAVEATVVGESALKSAIQRVVFFGSLVVVAGIGMVYLADELAEYEFSFGKLGHTFVGTIGLALATSLPELVVSATAIRMKKFELAIGNVFGSNLFNILVLAICQLAYAPFYSEPFYAGIHPANLITAFLAAALAGVAIGGLVYQSRRTMLWLGWDTAAILVLFTSGMYLVFLVGR